MIGYGCASASCQQNSDVAEDVQNDLPENPYQNKSDLPPPQVQNTRTVAFPPSWYNDFKWLHYKPGTDAVFVCLKAYTMKLFSPSIKIEPTFILNGFKNWSKGKQKLLKHQESSQHVDAIYKTQEKTSIATQLDRNRKIGV